MENPATDRGSIDDVLPRTIVERASKPQVGRNRKGSIASKYGSSFGNNAILEDDAQNENTPLLNRNDSSLTTRSGFGSNENRPRSESATIHEAHHHTNPKPGSSKHGHSHGNLNMRGVFLHVLGDALGNIGVIATALFIMYSTSKYKFYADPIISLVITCIIFSSALPLCRSASKILLQAVPGNIDLEEVKEDLSTIPGVEDVHELHIWQLSDVKMVASVHVRVAFDTDRDQTARVTEKYMNVDRAIRTCLHAYGIHSSTIQQEFVARNKNSPLIVPTATGANGAAGGEVTVWRRDTGEVVLPGGACLLDCGDGCEGGKCCPGKLSMTRTPSSHSG